MTPEEKKLKQLEAARPEGDNTIARLEKAAHEYDQGTISGGEFAAACSEYSMTLAKVILDFHEKTLRLTRGCHDAAELLQRAFTDQHMGRAFVRAKDGEYAPKKEG